MPKREWVGLPDDAFVLSQSVITSLDISPCRVTTIPKGFRVPPSDKMFAGTTAHALFEGVVTGARSLSWGRSAQNVLSLAEMLLVDEALPEGWTLETLVGNPFEWASNLTMVYEAWVTGPWQKYKDAELVEAEKPRAKLVPGGPLSNGQPFYVVTGGIDAVYLINDFHVGVDWKSTGRMWSKSDGPGLIQHDFYGFLVSDEYEFDRFNYEVISTRDFRAKTFPVQVHRRAWESALARARGWAEFLILENRPHLCTPSDMKRRGWWSKPDFNHGHCPTCKPLGDDVDVEWMDAIPAPLVATEDRTNDN